jgi:ACT domain-containing protein
MSDHPDTRADGGEQVQTHTIRLELSDEPGELLSALEPIAENSGNLLSIFHERGNVTPRGRIPVEVDLECPPGRFDTIVEALRAEGINVIQAGAERYGEEATVLLIGHLVDTDLSDTLQRIEACTDASIDDFSLSASQGTDEVSSARVRLATRSGRTEQALDTVRALAEEKDLRVVVPLEGSS